MVVRRRARVFIAAAAAMAVVLLLVFAPALTPHAQAATLTTAWQNGAFSENTGGIVSRSDVVLGQPNTAAAQSMPLGNGSLGVAAWAANGFTAQLNRSDTMPSRLSPGQVQIPGLAAMTTAANFSGHLDLYNGVLDESGGGMTMQAWVPAGKDDLIVEVTGAKPGVQQTATLNLWSGRTPAATASGAVGALAQTWLDNTQAGSSGQTFGAMAAITAGGQNVTASVVSSTEVQVAFTPNANGSFAVVVASPGWTGGNAISTASTLIGSDATTTASTLLATQAAWWNTYWANADLIEMNSSDGQAAYMENLRTIYLYTEAASMKTGAYPGSQAGVADMFAYDKDQQDWYPESYWLWNLRGQIASNLSSGDFALNLPIFTMYLNDLPSIESWTSAQMGGLPGACVPEVMRFNGSGDFKNTTPPGNADCSKAASPNYNAETVTSGAELSLWIWQQYQDTGSISFLKTYYPILEQAATFLLAYQTVGSDGYLHATANAHETQWQVSDPTTDMAADASLFPAVVSAATLLGTDSTLVAQLKTAEGEIEPYARVGETAQSTLLNAQPTSASAVSALDAQGTDAIADSYQPSAGIENSENIGMEPVWPYGVIGDATVVNGDNLTALADRTFADRPNTDANDWSFDAVDAARLDEPSAVESNLVALTEKYQAYVDGMGNLYGNTPGDEPYIEQASTVATALDEALATDYDGTLRIAPAWPSGWDASGTVSIQGNSKVDVQVESGTITTAAIQAGTTETMSVRNPWSGGQAEVVNGSTGVVVVAPTSASTLSVPVVAGSAYLVEQPSNPTTSLSFAQVTGTQATTYKTLGGKVQIGLARAPAYSSLAASFNNVAITADTDTAPGNFDGGDASYSETALTNAGAAPGAAVTSGGVTYTFPNVAAGANDNTVAQGQTISVTGHGSTLGFLASGSYGPATGTGTITYTDGTTQSYTLTVPDWSSTTPSAGDTVAITSAYENRPGNTTYNHTGDIFAGNVPLNPNKTVNSVTLPPGGTLAAGSPALHVFAIGFGGASLASTFDNAGISADTNTNLGNFDASGNSYSETALTNAGAAPGAAVTSGGVTYTFPDTAVGADDNTVVDGQKIAVSGSAADLGFLLSASHGQATGTGTITYTDGTTQTYTLTAPDWFTTTAPTGVTIAISSAYRNLLNNTAQTHATNIFAENVALNSAKTVASVTLPPGGALTAGSPAIHVFAIALS